MAGNRALAAVGRSIVDLLNRRLAEMLPAPRPRAVLAGTADFEEANGSPVATISYPPGVITIYCYRVTVDPQTRPGWSAVAFGDGVPRIPLRLHMLIAAWDTVVESELEWLGMAAQILESEGILSGPLLHPSGDWEAGEVVQVVLDDLSQDSMSDAFQALTTEYRLSLPYVARVICITGRKADDAARVSTVAVRTDATP
ncbi:DUF4255 domain-containing protein [Arthrobacter sp. Soil736]|uniref:DUF4255 domain-containing protein n=1 Tax=Arthrobacter sp. Soil736 TaxID=1736395 RepID=UPI0009EB05FF|nr:DUF4255 domain-containing protein [Arthrobacter sp. Soil736]